MKTLALGWPGEQRTSNTSPLQGKRYSGFSCFCDDYTSQPHTSTAGLLLALSHTYIYFLLHLVVWRRISSLTTPSALFRILSGAILATIIHMLNVTSMSVLSIIRCQDLHSHRALKSVVVIWILPALWSDLSWQVIGWLSLLHGQVKKQLKVTVIVHVLDSGTHLWQVATFDSK